MGILKSKKISRKTLSPFDDLYQVFFGGKNKGFSVNSNEDVYEKIVWVNACVNTIATKVASIPMYAYMLGTDKKKPKFNEKVASIFKNPSADKTQMEWFQSIIIWKKLRGFVIIENNYPYLTILDSDRITFSEGKLIYNGVNKSPRTLQLDNIAILKNNAYKSSSLGISQVSTLMPTAQLQSSIENANKNILDNGAILPFMLSTDQSLTPSLIDKIKEKFRENFQGIDNAGSVPVLHSGLKPISVGISPVDLGVLAQEQITKQRIATVFGVPSIYLNDMQNVNYATAKTQQELFVRNTILPELALLKQQIEKYVLPMIGQSAEIYFDTTNLPELADDEVAKATRRTAYVQSGIYTINEMREEDGMQPVAWGNTWWRSFGLTDGTDMIIDQTEVISEPTKSIENFPEILVTKNMTKEQRGLYWRMYVSKTFSQELKMQSELRKLFIRQKKETLAEYKNPVKFVFDDKWKEIFYKTLKPLYYAYAKQAGESMVDDYGIGIVFDVGSPVIAGNIEKSLSLSTAEIIKTTERQLSKELEAGITNGETVDQLSKRISNVYNFAEKYRSKTIARTEVNAVNNMTMMEFGKEAQMNNKIWSAALDERTRDSHLAIDGMSVPLDGIFEVANNFGFDAMQSPGDHTASPENVINCRCVVVFE